ncbi:hypothetical protein G6F35_015859 [Rhizopus arrhizus]|nr:hypothetical protein G6F35_015859 [Rhizopus arrhizus]
MLKLCEQHSLSLGYRWNPTKCAVLNHPPSSSSSSSLPSSSDRLQLYDTPLPMVDEFVYLGVPFVKSGLSAPSLVSLRSPGVIKVMAILNKIGVNRQGFSLLLCSRIYATFVRPKFEKSARSLSPSPGWWSSYLFYYDHQTYHYLAIYAPSCRCAYNSFLPSFALSSWFLPAISLIVNASGVSYQSPPRQESALLGSAFSSSVLRCSAQDLLSPVS